MQAIRKNNIHTSDYQGKKNTNKHRLKQVNRGRGTYFQKIGTKLSINVLKKFVYQLITPKSDLLS